MRPTPADINDRYNRTIKAIVESAGEDYWQTPLETLMLLTGDCEDYAVVKAFTLLHLGYEPKDLSIECVRLKAEYYGGKAGELINHAVCVYQGWVLDNYVREIVKRSARVDIQSTYAVLQLADPMATPYPQWVSMLRRRMPEAETQFLQTMFGPTPRLSP